jgi:hypothetical protein
MRTARTLEAEWRQVLRRSVSMGPKEDESDTGRVWATVFHRVTRTVRSRLAHVLKLTNHLFIYLIFQFLFGPWWTEDNESVNTGARMYVYIYIYILIYFTSTNLSAWPRRTDCLMNHAISSFHNVIATAAALIMRIKQMYWPWKFTLLFRIIDYWKIQRRIKIT